MKRLILFFAITFLLLIVIFCLQQANYYWKQKEAKDGLETLVTQLPEIENFDVVQAVDYEFSHTAYGTTCYYARAYVIIGTPLSEPKALDIYAEKLGLLGWTSEGKQYETSRDLVRGTNDRVIIGLGEPDIDIDHAVDYGQLRKAYQSVIFVRIDYMVPNRGEC